MIRAFVALPLPPEIARRLAAAQAGLPVGRAVPQENLHLTLAFLGEHPEPIVEDVHHALSRIAAPAPSVRIEGAGLLGKPEPRVLYAGVAPDPALGHLRKKVWRAAEEAGLRLARERFLPHVTLARLPRQIAPEDRIRLEGFTAGLMGLAAGPEAPAAFHLYESRLGSEGPSYTALADYPLS